MDISESVERLMNSKDTAVSAFYEKLFQRHPEFESHFRGVDIEQQATMLTMALLMIEGHFSHSYRMVEHYLHVLGDRHKDRGIPRELFPKFRDCLLETLQEIHADDWNDRLATQWQEAIDDAIAEMLKGYEQSFIY